MVHDHPCDDGNLIDGDGCSSSCQIETNYGCINGTEVSASVCSYNGSLSLEFVSGDKNPDKNAMTLTYILDTIDPLITLNNGSTDFTSWVSFP